MKFYESGKSDQVMPSGVSQRQLPHENFQVKKLPQSKAVLAPRPTMAQNQAIVQALRQNRQQAHGAALRCPLGVGLPYL